MDRPELDLSLVIPCYNEEAVLPITIPELERAFDALPIRYELILVDNGSTDRTGGIIDGFTQQGMPVRKVAIFPNRLYGGGGDRGPSSRRGPDHRVRLLRRPGHGRGFPAHRRTAAAHAPGVVHQDQPHETGHIPGAAGHLLCVSPALPLVVRAVELGRQRHAQIFLPRGHPPVGPPLRGRFPGRGDH